MRIATPESWYETRSMGEGVTLIHEPHILPFYRCNMWHVRGRDRDLLLDSGMGVVPLRRHVALLAERPLLAVASHTHFDHIGAHHEFPERAVHRLEAEILARPGRGATLADLYVKDEMFSALPPAPYDSARYAVMPAPATRVLEAGDVIDLGDRHFEVLHLPGHSPGSIGLWEAKTQILFSADAVYDGPLIDDCYHSVVEDYVATMERLRALPARVIHGGHFPSFDHARYQVLIDDYLAGKRRPGCPRDIEAHPPISPSPPEGGRGSG
jgi:glyoxylase-like metal-dependent hydrolase (beta-lactamase superfamily II)